MLILPDLKAAFLHIPKTGGQSIADALGHTHQPNHHSFGNTPPDLKDWFRFCFVREPFDRFLSAYRYTQMVIGRNYTSEQQLANHPIRRVVMEHRITSFAQFCQVAETLGIHELSRSLHFRPQMFWIEKFRPHFIGRFEDLDRDFARLCLVLGVTGSLKVKNKSQVSDDLVGPYGKAERQAVARLYRLDYTFLYSSLFGRKGDKSRIDYTADPAAEARWPDAVDADEGDGVAPAAASTTRAVPSTAAATAPTAPVTQAQPPPETAPRPGARRGLLGQWVDRLTGNRSHG